MRMPLRLPRRSAPHEKLRIGTPENPNCAPGVATSSVLKKRGRGQEADAVLGIGHRDTSAEHITRGLIRIAERGVRSANVRELAGVSFVLSRHLPEGLYALRTANRITAYRAETGVPVISLECGGA